MSSCRLCGARLRRVVADLGATPLANAFLSSHQLDEVEPYYPLRAVLCESCFLVQLDHVVPPDTIFDHYLYFSSYADARVDSSKAFADAVFERLRLERGDRVIEVASNDGYLLRHFTARGIDVLGIEPARNVASVAIGYGIPTIVDFFGVELAARLAAEGRQPRLIVANNVLAHVPEPNDFIEGLRILLHPDGMAALEFHHLLQLLCQRQFDNIYHEHFQYLSLTTARRAFASHGLTIVDVEEIAAQGGSLRVWVRHAGHPEAVPTCRVAELLERERVAGLTQAARYDAFAGQIIDLKLGLLEFLVAARRAGASVVGYGAAAKGNTLLNYCGVRPDLVEYVVDRNPHKQGLFLPGSRIPIRDPGAVMESRPDYLLILPWNLREEVMAQMSGIRAWGGRFVVPVPALAVLD